MIVRSRAPLRLGLAGGGTDVSPYCDVHGGNVLNATISLYAYAVLEPRSDGRVCFKAADRGDVLELPMDAIGDVPDGLRLHKGVYSRMVRAYNGGRPLAMNLTTYSDVPAGSGLGSSSTLVVAMLQAFADYLTLPLGEYDIAHLACDIERRELQLQGGKQDQYAATFGGVNFIEFYDNDRVIVNPLRVRSSILQELEASLVLYYTGTSRDSGTIIAQQIEGMQRGGGKSLDAMHQLREDAKRMKEALLKGDILAFAQIMGGSWEAKKATSTRISNAEIDRVYEAAIANGAYSGKVSGAGGGGFMMFLVEPVNRPHLTSVLRSFGGQVMPAHFVPDGAQAWRAEVRKPATEEENEASWTAARRILAGGARLAV